MKQILCSAALVGLCLSVQAQSKIKGHVKDAITNEPLSGATITYAGEKVIAATDGSFILECGKASSIFISYVGYLHTEKAIKDCHTDLEIALSPSTEALGRVEITATSNLNKALIYQPAAIAKLSSVEIRRGTGLFMDDAINTNVTGMTMMRRTVSAGQQFNIRGYGNGVRGTNGISSNFDGQGYKMYLNGIPITDAEGITLMDDIDFGSVGSVEVLKGPAGTLYGQAISGVINLKSSQPVRGKTFAGQEAIIGGYGFKRFTTYFGMGTEHSSLFVNYGYQESDGYMAHSASTKRFLSITGDFTINDKQAISAYIGHSNSYDQRGGELTIAQYLNNDYSGNAAYIKNNAHSEVLSFRGGISHSYQFSGNVSNTTTLFGTGLASNVSSAGGWTDKNPINYGVRSTLDTRFAVGREIILSGKTGIETQTQFAETIGYTMGSNPADPDGNNIILTTRSNQYTRSGTMALFSEWTLSLPHDLFLTGGLGHNAMKIELNDRIYAAGKPSHYSRKYDDMFSTHVAINKVFNKQFSLYASYSQGYKAPVSSYFFIPFTGQVNTNLEPEKGIQYEVGSKGSLFGDKVSYEVAAFQARFTNKMSAVPVLNAAGTATAYSYVINSGGQENKGLEAAVRYTIYNSATGFFRMVRPFVNVTYSDFIYKNYKFQTNALQPAVDYSGKQVAGVPKNVFNAGVDVNAAFGVYFNLVYNYRDPMPFTSDGVNRTTSYNLLNGKIGIRRSLSAHFDVDGYVGVTNLGGEKYYYMVFVNQLPDAYLPAPKDPFYFGGLNVKYNF
jgi:iron complex outermembrane recepter protein